MAVWEEELARALDADPPRDVDAWGTTLPLDDVMRLASGREIDTIDVAVTMLEDPTAPRRARRNAVALLGRLLLGFEQKPTAEDVFDALTAGEPLVLFPRLRSIMAGLLDDPDVGVRVAAAAELVKLVSTTEIPALRSRVAHVIDDMRERRHMSRDVQLALLRLGGAGDAEAWLEDVAASEGPLPSDLGLLVNTLEADPPPSCFRHLPGLFARVPAIVERRDPQRVRIAGVSGYDADTILASSLLRLYLRTCPANAVSTAVAMVFSATPTMGRALIETGVPTSTRGARLLTAIAFSEGVDPDLHDVALAALALLARRYGPGSVIAAATLRQLRIDDEQLAAKIDRFIASATARDDEQGLESE